MTFTQSLYISSSVSVLMRVIWVIAILGYSPIKPEIKLVLHYNWYCWKNYRNHCYSRLEARAMEETLDAVVDYDNDNLDNIAVDYAGDKYMNLNCSKNWYYLN